MSARDVLHRLVDDLDEDDALLLASVAASGPAGGRLQADEEADLVQSELLRILTATEATALYQATSSGIWSEPARIALRRWLDELQQEPRRFAVLSLILVPSFPHDVREQIAATFRSWNSTRTEQVGAGRERVVADALGSVRAEGLEPSPESRRQAAEYEAGRISADELYAEALGRARSVTGR